jgi:hypothetical protein
MTPATFDFTIYRGVAFGPLLLYMKDTDGNPVNLTGWTPFVNSRNNLGQKFDLQPVITNPATGEVTIQFNYTQTPGFKSGDQPYDLLFRYTTGQIIGPFLTGIVHVKDKITTAP